MNKQKGFIDDDLVIYSIIVLLVIAFMGVIWFAVRAVNIENAKQTECTMKQGVYASPRNTNYLICFKNDSIIELTGTNND